MWMVGSVVVALVVAGCDSSPTTLCDGCVIVEGLPNSYTSQLGIADLAIDPEGRIVAAVGELREEVGFAAIARMDRFGVLDPPFGLDGMSVVPLGSPQAVVVMADGSIRIGGVRTVRNQDGPAVYGVIADGHDDGLRLGADVASSESAFDVMDQNGALVVAYARYKRTKRHLVRYTATGERDASFPALEEEAIAITPGGGFVLASGVDDADDVQVRARRVTRDGEPDPSFGGGAPVVIPGVGLSSFSHEDTARLCVAPSAAGGLILTGYTHPGLFVARLDAAGRLDPRFGGGRGFITHDILGTGQGTGLVETAEGGIVVVGWSAVPGSFGAAVIRFAPDGSLDPTFGDGGLLIVDAPSIFRAVVAMPNGDVVVGGTAHVDNPLDAQAEVRWWPLLARFPAR